MPILRKTVCHNRKAVLFGGQVLQPGADYVCGVFEEVNTGGLASPAGSELPKL